MKQTQTIYSILFFIFSIVHTQHTLFDPPLPESFRIHYANNIRRQFYSLEFKYCLCFYIWFLHSDDKFTDAVHPLNKYKFCVCVFFFSLAGVEMENLTHREIFVLFYSPSLASSTFMQNQQMHSIHSETHSTT